MYKVNIVQQEPDTLEGGPVWREDAYAFDRGCALLGLTNALLGQVIPLWAGRTGDVGRDTIAAWRTGTRAVPVWALRGMWRNLRNDGHEAETLRGLLGFAFED